MAVRLPRNDLLLKQIRISAGETDYDVEEEHGISDDFLLSALVDASNFIHLHLVNERVEPFSTYKDITVVNSESVAVPTNIFSDNMVYNVWFSSDGVTFRDELDVMYKRTGYLVDGIPEQYIAEGGYLYFDKKISSGTVRVRYERLIDTPDIRRGQVDSVTGTLPNLTAITIDVAGTDGGFYKEAYWASVPEYISINDRDGNVLMRDIPVVSFDTSTGVITLDTFTAQSGETCPVDSWVCFGPNSSTHIKLPSISRTFFTEYAKSICFEGRSQEDIATTNPRMMAFLEQLTEAYGQLPTGFSPIPIRRGG